MAEQSPLEIICAPCEVFITTESGSVVFPDTEDTPPSPWVKMGTNGSRSIAEGGVTGTHEQVLVYHRVEGSTGPVKATRTSEDLRVSFTLLDLTAGVYTHGLAGDAVTMSGTTRSIPLSRNFTVRECKLLIRGASPQASVASAQYQIPRAVQNGNVTPVYSKGAPAALAFEFLALEDPSSSTTGERFGTLVTKAGNPS